MRNNDDKQITFTLLNIIHTFSSTILKLGQNVQNFILVILGKKPTDPIFLIFAGFFFFVYTCVNSKISQSDYMGYYNVSIFIYTHTQNHFWYFVVMSFASSK